MSFDPIESLEAIEPDQLEALIEVMYLAADADGELGAEERRELASSIARLSGGSRHGDELTSERLERWLERFARDLSGQGREQRLSVLRERLGGPAVRKAAFGLSVQVSASDGIVRTSEREFLLDLATALDVDRDEAADLVRQMTRP